MNFKYLLPVVFFIYNLQDMSKFFLGLGTGIYVGTYYNFKPVVEYIEDETKTKYNEFIKFIDQHKTPDTKDSKDWTFWSKKP